MTSGANEVVLVRQFTAREFGVGVAVIACGVVLGLGAALGVGNFLFAPLVPELIPPAGLALPLAIFSVPAAIPAFVLAVALTIRLVRRRSLTALELALALLSFGAFTFGLGTLGAGLAFERNKKAWLADAIEYCDRLRPELEQIHGERGAYPSEIDELHIDAPRPWLARTGDVRYSASADRYEIKINTSRGLSFFGASFQSDEAGWKFIE